MSTETGLCDQSTLASNEMTKVGICSEEITLLPQDVRNKPTSNVGANSEYEPVDSKNQSDYKAGSETSREDNTQTVETAFGAKELTETSSCYRGKTVMVGGSEKSMEGTNQQELSTSNQMQMASEAVQQSSENCCANKDGTESGLRIIEGKNIKIDEVQENALHGQFSSMSCKTFSGSNFDMDSNIECSLMYDETAFLGTSGKSASGVE